MTPSIVSKVLLVVGAVFPRSDGGPADGSILLHNYLESHAGGAADLYERATNESFVGDYMAAQSTYAELTSKRLKHTAPLTPDFTAAPVKVLAEAAKGKQVVALNEAHILAQTRTVTLQLLPLLREQGFNILALEGLDPTPDDLTERGYPLETSGPYIREPVFGELIRTAIELGFKVVPYEASSAQGLTPEKREQAQFENLSKVILADPSARVVVHAGYGHIFKTGRIEGAPTMMQRLLKHIPAASVLIIDQTDMVPGNAAVADVYASAMARAAGNDPFVLRRTDATFYATEPDRFDITVVFPPTKLSAGRPTWLALNGTRSPHPVNSSVCDRAFPCLVEAHYSTEPEHAVAADRFLFSASGQEVFMYTRRRPVTFSVTDQFGTRVMAEPASLAPYQLPY